jgi:hypothetical protein
MTTMTTSTTDFEAIKKVQRAGWETGDVAATSTA